MYWRQEQENWRVTVFCSVLLLHLMVGIILMRSSRLLSASRMASEEMLITFPLLAEQSRPSAAIPARRKPDPNARAISPKHSTAASDAPEGVFQPDYSLVKRNDVWLLPPIDWAHEAELAVQGSIAAAEREKLYRNLAGLSAAQLEWIRKNHMEPVDTNPPWSETSPRNNGDGILWISDHCALVNLVPYCFIKFGHKEARGDLFKNMRQYLDQRLTDPLP